MSDTILTSSAGVAAILTSTAQGPAGALASPTGTGFVHVTGGMIDGAARAVNLATADVTGILAVANGGTGLAAPGTSGNILTSNGTIWTSTAPAPGGITQLTSDVTAGPGSGSQAATVVAVRGQSVAAGTGTGQVWQFNGTSWAAAAATSLGAVTWANDLAGSSSTTQTVVSAQSGAITFASGTGLIGFASADTGPGLSQASKTSDVAAVPLVIDGQSAYAGAVTNVTGGGVVISGGAGATTNGTPGNVTVQIGLPSGSGSNSAFYVDTNLGTHIAKVWQSNLLPSGWKSLLLGNGSSEISSDGTNFFLNAGSGGTVGFGNGGNRRVSIDNSIGELGINPGWNLSVGAINGSYGGGGGVIGIAKAATNPSASISTGGVIFADSTSGALCLYPAGVTAPGLSVGTFFGLVGATFLGNVSGGPATSVSGGVLMGASSGALAVVPTGASTPILNVSNSSILVGAPISGSSTVPFNFTSSSIAVTTATITLSAAQCATPKLILTGALVACVLDFGTNGVNGVWTVDMSGITNASGFTLSFKNGTQTRTITPPSTVLATSLTALIVVTSGTNIISIT